MPSPVLPKLPDRAVCSVFGAACLGPPCPAQPGPTHPSPASPGQQPGQLSPAARQPQPSPRALPKPCQGFLTGFRRIVLGRRNASYFVRFRPVWGRRAAAFPCCEGVLLQSSAKGFVCTGFKSGGLFRFWCGSFGAAMPSPARPNPAQPSQPSLAPSPAPRPAQPSTQATPAQPAGIAKAVPKAFLSDSDASFSAAGMVRFGSVFGPFGAAVPLCFPEKIKTPPPFRSNPGPAHATFVLRPLFPALHTNTQEKTQKKETPPKKLKTPPPFSTRPGTCPRNLPPTPAPSRPSQEHPKNKTAHKS